MRILKPGDPCPCCGQPIRAGLPMAQIMMLSYIRYGLELREALKGGAEHEQQACPGDPGGQPGER